MSFERVEIGNAVLYRGDCLEVLPTLDAQSIDAVVTDPPYGQTECRWDSPVALDELWEALKRVTKPAAAIVLTAMQPFTSYLVSAWRRHFRCDWVWEKNIATRFFDANRRPLRAHENVLVFSHGRAPKYRPQLTAAPPYTVRRTRGRGHLETLSERRIAVLAYPTLNKATRHPRSVLRFACDRGLHPTQKPVSLMAYMARTYSEENDVILDGYMGSGTTGVACAQTGRRFIGVENDRRYFDIACKRIEEAQKLVCV